MGLFMQKISISIMALLLAALLLLSGCSSNKSEANESSADKSATVSVTTLDLDEKASAKKSVNGAGTTIILKESSAEISGDGAKADGTNIVITKAGSYAVSGRLYGGRIVVNAGSGKVNVILNGADISCDYSAAIFVKTAGLFTLTAYDESVNILSDATEYSYGDLYSNSEKESPDACLYCEKDMVINGGGKLIVKGNSKNAVTGKENVNIEGLELAVKASGHGITGKEALSLKGVKFSVIAGGDGLRSNSAANASVGTVTLLDSAGSITSGEDSVQAETTLTVESGSYALLSGGGSDGIPSAELSAKGLKGGSAVKILGGFISADCLDDAIHSNASVELLGGSITVKSGDDGVHADDDISLSGGNLVIAKSYEGLEATNITLSGGSVQLTASDDGVNISGGDGSAEAGRPGMDFFGSASGGILTLSGGDISINAEGDGIDANGDIEISGGTVIINGPTRGGNGVLDFDGDCKITGGRLIALGSADMAQTPSESSTQNSLVFTAFSGGEAESLVSVKNSNGTELITHKAIKEYNWVCVSLPEIKTGQSYDIYVGGEKDDTLTAEGVVTSNGAANGFGGPHNHNKNPDRFGRPNGGGFPF